MKGRDKLTAVRAAIRAIDKVGLAKEVRQQKLLEAQDIADAVLDAEVRIGELTSSIPKSQGSRTDLKLTDTAVRKSASTPQLETPIATEPPKTQPAKRQTPQQGGGNRPRFCYALKKNMMHKKYKKHLTN